MALLPWIPFRWSTTTMGHPWQAASSFQLLAGVSTPSNTKAAGSLGLSRICIGTHRCHQKVGLLSSMFVWSWLTFFSVSWGVCHMAWHWAFVERRRAGRAEEMAWQAKKNAIFKPNGSCRSMAKAFRLSRRININLCWQYIGLGCKRSLDSHTTPNHCRHHVWYGDVAYFHSCYSQNIQYTAWRLYPRR